MPTIRYQEVRDALLDADLLLFRRRSLVSIAGRGQYSHAAIAAWWGDDLFCLEQREWCGGRAVLLGGQVLRRSGRIDVYRDDSLPSAARRTIVRVMRRQCGVPYGWRHLFAAARLHLPGVRLFSRPLPDPPPGDPPPGDPPPGDPPPAAALPAGGPVRDDPARVREEWTPKFCSEAIAYAFRRAGIDLVPRLADCETDPNDLARSALLRFVCTLS